MAAEHRKAAPSLEEALADLKQIRETLDRSRADHPIRLVGRPLMALGATIGGLILIHGVVAQLILARLPGGLGSVSAPTLVWLWSALLLAATAVAKVGVMAVASRRAGFDANKLVSSVMTMDYVRILVPIYLLAAVAGVGLGVSGRADMLPGLITVACGAAYLAIPAFLPLGELTLLGCAYVVLGCAAMFILPEWPFYKSALVLGLPMLVAGLLGRRAFPVLGAAPKGAARPLREARADDEG